MSATVLLAEIHREEWPPFHETGRSSPGAPARSIPAVSCTAFGQQHPAERALAAGFAAHLRKPVDPLTLSQTLRRVLDQPRP